MKRTTIMLPDDLAALLNLERQRRDASAAEIIRQALVAYLEVGPARTEHLPFVGLGRSGQRTTARDAETILTEEWRPAGDR